MTGLARPDHRRRGLRRRAISSRPARRAGDEVVRRSRAASVDLLDAGRGRACGGRARAARRRLPPRRARPRRRVLGDPAGDAARQRRDDRSTCSRRCAPRRRTPTVLAVGSGEVYGPPATLPVGEDAPLRPQNPYAVSKAVGRPAGGLLRRRPRPARDPRPRVQPRRARPGADLRDRLVRPPGRRGRAGEDPVRIVTGNPDTRRDYTDVRDVVRAYRLLAARAEPGIYNVCSGRDRVDRASWSGRSRGRGRASSTSRPGAAARRTRCRSCAAPTTRCARPRAGSPRSRSSRRSARRSRLEWRAAPARARTAARHARAVDLARVNACGCTR